LRLTWGPDLLEACPVIRRQVMDHNLSSLVPGCAAAADRAGHPAPGKLTTTTKTA